MILLSWMIWTVGVSALFALAAHWTERAGRGMEIPSRLPWAAAILLSSVLPWLPFGRSSVPAPYRGGEGGSVGVMEVLEVVSGGRPLVGSTFLTLDRVLFFVWAAVSLALVGRVVAGTMLARRRASGWREARLEGHPVLVSEQVGPAISGFVRGRIVVPQWLLGWEPELRKMAVDHEREHLRAHDPALRLFALAACVLAPWNPALWWQRSRLELAIECDCDRRVMARHARPDRYGALLVRAARTARADRSALPALSTSASNLEERIRRLFAPTVRGGRLGPLLAAVGSIGLVLGASAWSAPEAPDARLFLLLATSGGESPQLTDHGFLVLPGTPPEGRLEEELARHHPGVLQEGLPNGEAVWFIVDRDLTVVRTGTGALEGLEDRLRATHPAETSSGALAFTVAREPVRDAPPGGLAAPGRPARSEGMAPPGGPSSSPRTPPENPLTLEVVWMVQEPPPGTLPWWRP